MTKHIKEKAAKIIEKVGSILKIDLKYAIKGGFWLTFKQGIVALTALGLTIAFARLLDKQTFGAYKYILSIVSILTIPSLTGAYTAIVRAVAQGKEYEIKKSIKTRIYLGMIGSLGSLSLSIYYILRGNNLLGYSFLCSSLLIPFLEPLLTYDAFLIGKQDFKKQATLQIIAQLINTITVFGIIFFTNNLIIIVMAYLVSICATRGYLNYKILKKIPQKNTAEDDIISYGKHLSAIEILNIIIKYLDKILIFQFIGSAELAIYTIATAPLEYISTFIGNIQMLTLPKFSKNLDTNNNQKSFRKIMLIFGGLIALVTIIYITISPFLYSILFPTYPESVKYSQFFSLSLITAIAVIPFSYLQSKKSVKSLYYYNLASSIISTAILFASIHFGIFGIIIGRVVSRFIGLILVTDISKNITPS